MNNITVRAHHGTKDSYAIRNRYPETTAEDIIKVIKNHPYNRYHGGRVGSTMASIDYIERGFHFQDQIRLQFTSVENCREFEEAIKPHVEHFIPRNFKEVGV